MENDSFRLVEQVFALLFYALAYTAYQSLIRCSGLNSFKTNPLYTAYSSAVLGALSFFLAGEKNEGILVRSFVETVLLFAAGQVRFHVAPKLSTMYESIFSQPRLIAVYALSVVFLENKIGIFRCAGIAAIIASLVLMALEKKEKQSANDAPTNCALLASASCVSGFANFFFDFQLKPRIAHALHYVLVSKAWSLCLSVSYFGALSLLFESDLRILCEPLFHATALSYTAMNIAMLFLFFLVGVASRTISLVLVHALCDIFLDWRVRGVSWSVLPKYLLCVAGVLVYRLEDFKN